MTIQFKDVPKSRLPFIYVEFDNSKAQKYDFDLIYRVLLIGTQTDKAELNKPYAIKSPKDAADKFGTNSVLHQMSEAFFANASNSSVYAVAIPENATDLKDLIKNIKDVQFHLIANPYSHLLKDLQNDLNERFSPHRQLEGHMICAIKGDVEELTKKRNELTTPHITLFAAGREKEISEAIWSAAITGVVARYGQEDPAAPFKSCPIQGVHPGTEEDRFTRSEREALLQKGVSTWYSQNANLPRIELLVTTYKNELNEADESYLYTNTLLVSMAIRHSFVSYFGSKYARAKLADDGVFYPTGVQTLTPKIGKSEAVNLFKSWMDKGWVTGLDEFKNSLIVERKSGEPTRLDFYLEPKYISQLNVIAAKISFLI
jgi:phage tail sheath gpL-like